MKTNPISSNAEDLLIISQIRLFGDTAAFGALVKKYQSPLRRYLYHLTGGDRATADDLSQETLIKAYTSLGEFKGLGGFRGWLFRIAYRRFLDSLRTQRSSAEIAEHNAGRVEPEVQMLEQTLAPLTDTERNLIILSCIEECSHSEIAKITSIPLGTIKSTIARAKEKLKKHLEEDGKDF